MGARRPRIGSVLLCAFVVLLAGAVVRRMDTVAEATERLAADRALFARYAKDLPGRFGALHVKRTRHGDLACAAYHRARRAGSYYRLCVVVGGPRERPVVTRTYSSRIAA
jgi:hypothetical protein